MEDAPKSESNYYEQTPQHEQTNQLVRITKHPTYSTIAASNKNNSEHVPVLPSPLGSQETISNQAKFLAFKESNLSDQDEDQSVFYTVLYQCALYLKKEAFRSQADDQLILEKLLDYINITLTQTTPKNKVGERLLTNGYVLSCVAVSMARTNNSPALLKHFMSTFQKFEIQTNYQQFDLYSTKQDKDWEICRDEVKVEDEQRKCLKKNKKEDEYENENENENEKVHNSMLATKSSFKKTQLI